MKKNGKNVLKSILGTGWAAFFPQAWIWFSIPSITWFYQSSSAHW